MKIFAFLKNSITPIKIYFIFSCLVFGPAIFYYTYQAGVQSGIKSNQNRPNISFKLECAKIN